jgi:hypothetical protein
VQGDVVDDVAELQKKMEAVAVSKPSSVVLHVRRGFRTFFVEMQTGWQTNAGR